MITTDLVRNRIYSVPHTSTAMVRTGVQVYGSFMWVMFTSVW